MDLSTILTCTAAFMGGFVGAVIAYFIRQRGRPAKVHAPGPSPWPVEPLPLVHYAKIPDGAITSGKIQFGIDPGKIAFGPITPDDLAAGDPRKDR
ncbi:hypothetical protein [Streptomyces sp. NPDC007991]|uniref:hypothetical protein n=1 Tax=Streptomyces sp. NPDC007991 TaxID=3364803 RepID=UPI0036F15020